VLSTIYISLNEDCIQFKFSNSYVSGPISDSAAHLSSRDSVHIPVPLPLSIDDGISRDAVLSCLYREIPLPLVCKITRLRAEEF